MRIAFADKNGAGDKANVLPILRLLVQQGHDVFTHTTPSSIYLNTGIKSYEEGAQYDVSIPMWFEQESSVPGALIVERILRYTGINLMGQFGPGFEFDPEEKEFIEVKRALEYVTVFPYTNVGQKTIGVDIARQIVEFVQSKGFKVRTAPVIFDNNRYPWAKVFDGCGFYSMFPYFDRRWLVDMASSRLNICLDGGPFNVSLAAGAKTLGLLTVADKRLACLYPAEQWRVSQSTVPCSPCFKCVHEAGTIAGCVRPNDPCGAHFDLEDVYQKIEELL